ncbi:PD-(D/E)XK nuclease family protein [Coprothermobacteraceae bacterium]|nr:PD-(D/E)XK nuclease family protein [Coprothermobacteraceae bacterium]
MKRISVTSLLYWCPLHLDYLDQFPLETTGAADQIGSAVHDLIYRMLSGDGTGFFDTEEDVAWSVFLEKFPGAQVGPLARQVIDELLAVAKAAKRIAETLPLVAYEEKFEHNFGFENVKVVGIADAMGENVLLDWKTGSFPTDSHRQQVKVYATMLWRLGKLRLPASLSVVYLGTVPKGDEPLVRTFTIDESEAVTVESFVQRFLSDYLSNPAKPRISDHCLFCPYGRWCKRTVRDSDRGSAVRQLWEMQEKAYLLQKQIAPGFTEGIHVMEEFIVEKKGDYLRVRRKW